MNSSGKKGSGAKRRKKGKLCVDKNSFKGAHCIHTRAGDSEKTQPRVLPGKRRSGTGGSKRQNVRCHKRGVRRAGVERYVGVTDEDGGRDALLAPGQVRTKYSEQE